MEIETKKPRPYWHVDAKWIFGILFTFSLGIMLLTYNLAAVTSEKPAVDLMTSVLATMYSQKGLDDKTEIDQMKAVIAASPKGEVQPIPNVDLTIKSSDLKGLSPRQIRLNFFRKLADPIYTGNTDSLTKDPKQRATFLNDTKMVRTFISAETHQLLQTIFVVFAIISAICLIPFVYFSYRFGRLSNPGSVMIDVALPGVVMATFVATMHFTNTSGATDNGPLGALGPAVYPLLPSMAQTFLWSYFTVFITGVVLLIFATIGKIVSWFSKRKIKKQEAKNAT